MTASPKAGAHMAPLDGLRGLAIVMVLFVHFIGDSTPGTPFEREEDRVHYAAGLRAAGLPE